MAETKNTLIEYTYSPYNFDKTNFTRNLMENNNTEQRLIPERKTRKSPGTKFTREEIRRKNPNKRKYKKTTGKKYGYRLLPLLLAGLLISGLTIGVAGLIWAIIAYFTQQPLEGNLLAPKIIYMLALFLSCFFISYMVKATSIVPSLIFVVLMVTLSIFCANLTTFSWLLTCKKCAYSLIPVFCGHGIAFYLHKKYEQQRLARRRQTREKNQQQSTVASPSQALNNKANIL